MVYYKFTEMMISIFKTPKTIAEVFEKTCAVQYPARKEY